MKYKNTCGRFKVEVDDITTGPTVTLSMPNGSNEYVGHTDCRLSPEELFDLMHLIERAIAHSDEVKQ